MENGGRREDLAKRIYQIMEEGHMKQSAVARAAGISPSLFNAMLRGRKIIRAEHINNICIARRVSPNQLFEYDPNKKGA